MLLSSLEKSVIILKHIKNIFFILVFVFILSGCDSNNLKSLSYKEFNNKLKSNDSFFVEIVQDGCSHCANFTPKLKEVLNEYDIVGYQINLTDLSDEDYSEFSTKYGVNSTPTVIFIFDGQETSLLQRINGNISKDKIISKLKSNGYINE